jgi:hypothetical protein
MSGLHLTKRGFDGDGSYGEKHIFTHNFLISMAIGTLPMAGVFVLASRKHRSTSWPTPHPP